MTNTNKGRPYIVRDSDMEKYKGNVCTGITIESDATEQGMIDRKIKIDL